MSSVTSASTPRKKDKDIGEIIQILWDRKWLIMGTTFIFSIIGIAYAIMATPIYRGNALLQIETKSSGFAGFGELTNVFGGAGGGGGETSTELQILKSRKVLVPTITKYNLEIETNPHTFPIIGNYFYRIFGLNNGFRAAPFADTFPFTASYAWGGEQIVVNKFKVPEAYFQEYFDVILLTDETYSLNFEGVEVFEGQVGMLHHVEDWNIDIQIGKLTGRIGTYYELRQLDPILVIDDLTKDLVVKENGKSSGIVGISMEGKNKKKIKNIIDYVLSTYQEQNVEHSSIEAGRSLKFVKDQLPEATAKMKDAEKKIYEYRLNNKTVDLTLQTEQLLTQLLTIESLLNELNLEEPNLARKFKREHPIYIEFLRKKEDLEKKRDEVNLETGQIPTEQFNIFRLQRDVQLNQKIYLQMLNKYEELKIIKAGSLGSIRVIDNTIVHPKAIKPQKSAVVVIAFVLGLILSISYVLISSILSKVVKNIDQLEELDYNVFSSIPVSAKEEKLAKSKSSKMTVLSHLHPEDLTVESLRSLRTSLHFAMVKAKNNIIMVTGPAPNVGKSFISQNLATLIAQSDNKVLLVDADLRCGPVHERFGFDVKPGFSEYLSGTAQLDEICHKTKIEGLDVIARGEIPSNPSELLMSKKFIEFCNDYKAKYDFIILDAPPIIAVTDASIIGEFAGTTIMVAKQNTTHLKEIDTATKKLNLDDVGIKVMCLMVS